MQTQRERTELLYIYIYICLLFSLENTIVQSANVSVMFRGPWCVVQFPPNMPLLTFVVHIFLMDRVGVNDEPSRCRLFQSLLLHK